MYWERGGSALGSADIMSALSEQREQGVGHLFRSCGKPMTKLYERGHPRVGGNQAASTSRYIWSISLNNRSLSYFRVTNSEPARARSARSFWSSISRAKPRASASASPLATATAPLANLVASGFVILFGAFPDCGPEQICHPSDNSGDHRPGIRHRFDQSPSVVPSVKLVSYYDVEGRIKIFGIVAGRRQTKPHSGPVILPALQGRAEDGRLRRLRSEPSIEYFF